jgi:hypothetical protein
VSALRPEDHFERACRLHDELEDQTYFAERAWDRLTRHSDAPYDFGAWYAAWRRHNRTERDVGR